ncbi:hypothetical protein MBLNU13_g10834t2 [Cladosporium sp. NU13]
MNYQGLLATLLMVLILAAAFLTSCYTPPPSKTSKTSHPVQLAKWLRVAGMWNVAKISPLKKPNKGDYTLAKAWRPFSLLSTLGKLLEAVVAERISYAVETYGLLPANHFGARKQRSAEQALLLLQERTYSAWRSKNMVSLVSLGVKGAYNGVYKDRLLQWLAARGIPSNLVSWIGAFCSGRTATIIVNRQASVVRELEQAGLPQGSPLSPILFLFFNADLIQHRIDHNGGAIAFVDDYAAWVVGKTAAENMEIGLAIMQRATEWENRSGASLERDKTAFIHFTRNSRQSADEPISVKGRAKRAHLACCNERATGGHGAEAAARTLAVSDTQAVQREGGAGGRLRIVIRTYARRASAERVLRRVQWVGGQAVVGCFQTVSTAVAEAEANLSTIGERHSRKALRMWVNLHSMPSTHPLAQMIRRRTCKKHTSPLQKTADVDDGEQAAGYAQGVQGIGVATSASARNRLVGIGGAIDGIDWIRDNLERREYDKTVSTNAQSDACTAALVSIEVGLGLVVSAVYDNTLSAGVRGQVTHVFTNNRTALVALRNGTRRSGQWIISGILKHVSSLKESHNRVVFAWAPVSSAFELGKKAKQLAQRSTDEERVVTGRPRLTRSMVQRTQERLRRATEQVPATVGAYLRRIETAWPGKHTRRMYDDVGLLNCRSAFSSNAAVARRGRP